jgi:hypothetical protein
MVPAIVGLSRINDPQFRAAVPRMSKPPIAQLSGVGSQCVVELPRREVSGAPLLHVRHQEVGLKESYDSDVSLASEWCVRHGKTYGQ